MSEWIKCSERMPEDQQKVIVYGPGSWNKDGEQWEISYATYEEKHRYMNKFCIAGGEYDCGVNPVYWQPLPAPPAEEAQHAREGRAE